MSIKTTQYITREDAEELAIKELAKIIIRPKALSDQELENLLDDLADNSLSDISEFYNFLIRGSK